MNLELNDVQAEALTREHNPKILEHLDRQHAARTAPSTRLFHRLDLTVRLRRIFLVATSPDEGLLTERRTAAAQVGPPSSADAFFHGLAPSRSLPEVDPGASGR